MNGLADHYFDISYTRISFGFAVPVEPGVAGLLVDFLSACSVSARFVDFYLRQIRYTRRYSATSLTEYLAILHI